MKTVVSCMKHLFFSFGLHERNFGGSEEFDAGLCAFADHLPAKGRHFSRLVNSLKGVSSRLIRKKHDPRIERALWGGSLWSPSYFPGSAGGPPCRSKPVRGQRLISPP